MEKIELKNECAVVDLNDEDVITKILESGSADELEKLREFHNFSSEQAKLYRYFATLRKRTHEIMEKDLAARLNKNPQPTAEELNLGAFVENLEPQVRGAVLALRKKGYTTYESGFHGLNQQKIGFKKKHLDGFSLPPEFDKTQRLQGVKADASADSITLTLNRPLLLEEMQTCWDNIAEILPDLKKQAEPSNLPSAESFRDRFAKEGVEFLPYFPTDFERAKMGLEKFLELREKNPVFKKAVEGNETVLHSLMGLRPEAGYYWGVGLFENLSTEETKELRDIFEKELGFKIFSAVSKEGNQIRSIINPDSVTRVVRNCPVSGLFSEKAKDDPVKWLMEHHEEWGEGTLDDDPLTWDERQKTIISRFGVLSGYAPHASKVFPDAEVAEQKLKLHNLALSDDERSQYHAYSMDNRNTRKLPENLEHKLDTALKNGHISEYEAKLMRDRFLPDPFSVNPEKGINYVLGTGFFDEDKRFYDDMAKIIQKTGAARIVT